MSNEQPTNPNSNEAQPPSGKLDLLRKVLGLTRTPDQTEVPVAVTKEPGINDFYLENYGVNEKGRKEVLVSKMSDRDRKAYLEMRALANRKGLRGGVMVNYQTGQLTFTDSHTIAQITSFQTHGGGDDNIKELASRYAEVVDDTRV